MLHTQNIRKPAVAGTFYPDNAKILKSEIGLFLDNAVKVVNDSPMIIAPHAGYVFSAPVAASAYKSIKKDVSKVILLGPSHYKFFHGLSIPSQDIYETPLGEVPVNRDVVSKLQKYEFVNSYDDAHDKEHCLEVQIPFLQEVLEDFSIIPIIISKLDDVDKVAEAINEVVDEDTVIVVSSDLSHYMDHDSAVEEDRDTVSKILNGKYGVDLDACGSEPIKVAMSIAEKRGYEPQLLDLRNSFETAPQYGSVDRVVGYAAIAYLEDSEKQNGGISNVQKGYLLKIAREALVAGVKNENLVYPTEVEERLKEITGCFVTLKKQGNLRGCIGYIEGVSPLFKAVMDNAVSSAMRDYRFPNVSEDEIEDISIEVSVLTQPQKIIYTDIDDLLEKIIPNEDGIILTYNGKRSTFLPQVWEDIPDKVKFLEHLSRKAGLSIEDWKKADYQKYQAIHFEE